MERIIITTGYMGTGSSAATDLIAEFKDVVNDYSSFEYVFLHCPDGLFDLEDKLLLGNNAIRSDEAIRTFENRMKELYDKKFWWIGNYKKHVSPEFDRLTKEFINNITNFTYEGLWYMNENPNSKMIAKLLIRKPFKVLFHKLHNFKKITCHDRNMRISLIGKEEFYKFAKEYVYKVIKEITKDSSNVVLDQLLLPFNLHRMEHYFDDNVYTIVVDRDPRDVFILNKYIWSVKQCGVPTPLDAHQFCDYYKAMHESEKPVKSKKIYRLQFEDMIYRYDEVLKEIKDFLHYDKADHIHKKERFNPDISIKNTQLFRKEQYAEEIQVIERELHDYLYDFPIKIDNDVKETIETLPDF